MRITTNGQVTIPKAIRERLGLLPHTDVEFVVQGEAALPRELHGRVPVPYEAVFLAGKCFGRYRRRGGTKRSPLPDFIIGAHAAVAGFRLLTRDASRYREYYPGLEVIAP